MRVLGECSLQRHRQGVDRESSVWLRLLEISERVCVCVGFAGIATDEPAFEDVCREPCILSELTSAVVFR